jgi:hypothetical protein
MTASLIAAFGANAFAIEILVTPSDRDRLVKTQDGRQIRLPAGSELIKADDGRLAVRRALAEEEKSPIARAPSNAAGGDRWVWFVGAEGAFASLGRDYKIDADESNASATSYKEVNFMGFKFKTDGGSYKFSKDESVTSFAVLGGLKDEQEQNYYQFGYYLNDDLDELAFSAQFGFTSLAFWDNQIIPYARVLVGAGFADGVSSFDADSFSFGGGIGATYIYSPNVEFYGGFDYLMRNFGSKAGKATDGGGNTITYGTIEQEEQESRFYVGARYLFR